MKKLILIALITVGSAVTGAVVGGLFGTPESEPWRPSGVSLDTMAIWYDNPIRDDRMLSLSMKEWDDILRQLEKASAITKRLHTSGGTGVITNKYWTAIDYEVTNRFASYRVYGDVVIGFTHPVARDSFETKMMLKAEFYRLFDLPSYAETVAARECGEE